MVTEVSPVQPRKALLPMEVTVFGITVFLQPTINVLVALLMMALQLLLLSYTVLPAATVIDVRLLKLKAYLPMEVTELGIVTDVS